MFGKKKRPAAAARNQVKAASSEVKKASTAIEKHTGRASDHAKKSAGSARSAAKAADKAAEKAAPRGVLATVTDPKAARRALAVARMAGPVVAPVALRAATTMRSYLNERRAEKLGVPSSEVAAYRGPTGPAAARIATLGTAVDELRQRRSGDQAVGRFADVAKTRLGDLSTATKAAASMPAGRRRATLSAIRGDLNQIDTDLMTFLVGQR